MVVGPEGGFSDLEIQFLLDLGFQPLFLGPRVLRTENAALFALGAVQILLQEKKTWRLTEPATS
jgi:16S rRNA (uracil1498-N3)-methyltransferase